MIYVAYDEEDVAYIVIYNVSTMELTKTLETPCSYGVQSVRANGKYLALGCWTKNKVYLLKLGDQNATFDTLSDIDESNFAGPNVVTVDTEDNVLVVDEFHHRIQIYQAGTWQTLKLEPQPRYPTAAVYINDTLYVSGGVLSDSFYISMYAVE